MDRKFGWDLPPGVNVSDIPGNRPEDEVWEKMLGEFYKRLSDVQTALLNDNLANALIGQMEEIIAQAIEFGIEHGTKQQAAAEQEATFYQFNYLTKQVAERCDNFKSELLELLNKVEKGQQGDPP